MTFEQLQRIVCRLLINDYDLEPKDAQACVEDLYAHYLRAIVPSASGNEKIVGPYAADAIIRRLKASHNLVERFKAEHGFFGRD
jgi:hypothetical protein